MTGTSSPHISFNASRYCFGQLESGDLTTDRLQELMKAGQSKISAFAETPIYEIVSILDELSQVWQEGSPYWNEAFALTRKEVAFSDPMIRASLNVISELLSYRNVMARLKADFGSIGRLDRFIESSAFHGRDRAFSLGVLFHVSAGNVFLGAIDSLLMGFLTKNISVVKLSSRNLSFPMLFAKSLAHVDRANVLADKYALIHFAGGRTDLEESVKKSANAIIAWGGEEMITSYKRGLGMGVKFIEYGPKISFQVVTKRALERVGVSQVAVWISQDIAMWDQAACASPQNLFLEQGIDVKGLLAEVDKAFRAFPFPRGKLSDDECVEILKERARAEYDAILGTGHLYEGEEHLIHYESEPGLRTSPLNRSLIVKSFDDLGHLCQQLSTYKRYLQSCGFLVEDDEEDLYLDRLGSVGVMRFAHLGQVMRAPIGAPHDGKMTLVELTRIVPEEHDGTIEGLVNDAIAHVPFYNKLRGGRFVHALTDMPLITGADIDSCDEYKLKEFTHIRASGGYVFSSGGTSGAPKYSLYSHQEFSRVAELLARGFAAQGIKEGSVVANFFVAGNMWSSFLAVDQALGKLGARTLPIGGLTERTQALGYIKQFKPDFLIGLPTQLMELTRQAEESSTAIIISNVLYAGEHLSLIARQYIQKVFQTKHFGSAGYASVDAGPIGYQCHFGEGGIHHVFADDVHLEIIAGEGVVTSLVKRSMPVIRLRTGDLLDWMPETECCPCGSREPRFRLNGRANSQFNVWSCRLFLQEFEYALSDCGLEGALFQLVVSVNDKAQDIVTVRIELQSGTASPTIESFCDRLYHLSKDLKATHPRSWLDGKIKIECAAIERVARTGKIKSLIDQR